LQIKICLTIFFDIFLSSLRAIVVEISLVLVFEANVIARVERFALEFAVDCVTHNLDSSLFVFDAASSMLAERLSHIVPKSLLTIQC